MFPEDSKVYGTIACYYGSMLIVMKGLVQVSLYVGRDPVRVTWDMLMLTLLPYSHIEKEIPGGFLEQAKVEFDKLSSVTESRATKYAEAQLLAQELEARFWFYCPDREAVQEVYSPSLYEGTKGIIDWALNHVTD